MRLLVVDEDRDLREMVADLLLDSQVEVCEAQSADEALLRLRGERVDVLLCHLPILRAHGGRLLAGATSLPAPPRVIAMSASGLPQPPEVDAHLARPFTRAQLVVALRTPYPAR
jgi:CheY-like chemotaxis protein